MLKTGSHSVPAPETAEGYLAGSEFAALCERLSQNSSLVEQSHSTASSLSLCAEAGVFAWFVPKEFGGWGWDQTQITAGYLALSRACLTTTFVITQRVSAVQRILAAPNSSLRQSLLPRLLDGQKMVSIGISHLTTSRQHQAAPALSATPIINSAGDTVSWKLQGIAPWVTAAPICDYLVIGATCPDQSQILAVVDTKLSGVGVEPGFDLLALSASQTGAVTFDAVQINAADVLAGPLPQVLKAIASGTTGGLQTSTLAIGLASAAVDFIAKETIHREMIASPHQDLAQQVDQLRQQLMLATRGEAKLSHETLRTEANSLVLRATQAALIVAKGAGYVSGHPCGRWCREALFFLVWSCPQEVQMNNLCQLSLAQVG